MLILHKYEIPLMLAVYYWMWGRDAPLLYVSLFGFLFAVLGLCWWAAQAELRIDDEELRCAVASGGTWKRYLMRWSEIAKVEIDRNGNRIVIYADDQNKRLAVAGLPFFPGAKARLLEELEKRHIPLVTSGRAVYIESRNTEVK
ncbi:MAG TPA: hypothetical protein VF600_13095 [Abditibacteriaceae bacterium]|jgi:hypothetical protein